MTYFLLEEVGRGLSALNTKLTKLTLRIGCLAYHLASGIKLGLIQITSLQLPKAFDQHGRAETTKLMVITLHDEKSE